MHPIAAHRRSCNGCAPQFKEAHVFGRHSLRFGREVTESFAIRNSMVNDSSPSLALSEREMGFLHRELTG